jgi:hypothetical protein
VSAHPSTRQELVEPARDDLRAADQALAKLVAESWSLNSRLVVMQVERRKS